jgi:DNA-binding PadR family transcriptional regulator
MNHVPTQSDSHYPLTEVTYYVLLSLAPEDRHGYAIMKSVQRLSAGRVSLSTGTLYGALQRLVDQGWIMQIEEPQPNHPGRARKVYRLTQLGKAALSAEVNRLHSLLSAAEPHMMIQAN